MSTATTKRRNDAHRLVVTDHAVQRFRARIGQFYTHAEPDHRARQHIVTQANVRTANESDEAARTLILRLFAQSSKLPRRSYTTEHRKAQRRHAMKHGHMSKRFRVRPFDFIVVEHDGVMELKTVVLVSGDRSLNAASASA